MSAVATASSQLALLTRSQGLAVSMLKAASEQQVALLQAVVEQSAALTQAAASGRGQQVDLLV